MVRKYSKLNLRFGPSRTETQLVRQHQSAKLIYGSVLERTMSIESTNIANEVVKRMERD